MCLALLPVLGAPPLDAVGELLVLHRLGLAIATAACVEWDLVEPCLLCRTGLLEEQQVRRDLGITEYRKSQAISLVAYPFGNRFATDSSPRHRTADW
jgi:hypothetical protein